MLFSIRVTSSKPSESDLNQAFFDGLRWDAVLRKLGVTVVTLGKSGRLSLLRLEFEAALLGGDFLHLCDIAFPTPFGAATNGIVGLFGKIISISRCPLEI